MELDEGEIITSRSCWCCWPTTMWILHTKMNNVEGFEEIRKNKSILDNSTIDSAPFVNVQSELVNN